MSDHAGAGSAGWVVVSSEGDIMETKGAKECWADVRAGFSNDFARWVDELLLTDKGAVTVRN